EFRELAYVGTGGKVAAFPPYHDTTKGIIGGKLREDPCQLLPHEYGDRVQAPGVAQRDERDGAFVVEQDSPGLRAGIGTAHRHLRLIPNFGLPWARRARLSSSCSRSYR